MLVPSLYVTDTENFKSEVPDNDGAPKLTPVTVGGAAGAVIVIEPSFILTSFSFTVAVTV